MSLTYEQKQDTAAQVSYLTDVAETIRDDALATARDKLSALHRRQSLKKLLARPDFMEYFRYDLACGVAQALAANDPRVQAVYIREADADMSQGGTTDPTVHLLVKVSATSAALDSFVAALDRALAASLRALPSPAFEERAFVLDVGVVSEADVRQGRGYAALLSSVFAPPLMIWAR